MNWSWNITNWEENVLSAKKCLHEKLRTPSNRLKKDQWHDGAKRNLQDTWVYAIWSYGSPQDQTSNGDRKHWFFSDSKYIYDINAISFYGDLTQLKAETRKLEEHKVKIEETLKGQRGWKQTNYSKEIRAMVLTSPLIFVRIALCQPVLARQKTKTRTLHLTLHTSLREHIVQNAYQNNVISVSNKACHNLFE